MGKFKDLTGQKFNRLLVLNRAKNKNKKVYWNCKCDCGKYKTVESYSLTSGQTQSCGCYNLEKITKHPKIKHNGEYIPVTSHPLFPIYHGIKNRCYNKNLPTYERWGGRGIRMSKSWYFSFEQFVRDMGDRPSDKHTIDRKDNEKGYNKNNCIWATDEEQANNKRNNIKIEYKGEVRTLAQTAKFVKIPYSTFYHYFVVLGITEVDLIVNFLKHREGRKLNTNELKTIRKVQHMLQNYTCPILKKQFSEKDMVVDHLHKKHADLLNLDNAGCVRGVIHRQANSFEGKIANLMIRLGMHKLDISLPEILINIAEYLSRPPLPYIHPSESPKKAILTKSSYNKLVKAHSAAGIRSKLPEYRYNAKGKPVQGLTKPIEKLFIELDIEPEFYSK